jgi:hypothetical protein
VNIVSYWFPGTRQDFKTPMAPTGRSCPSQWASLLRVSDGGIGNVGCMKWDLQNYYQGTKEKIKDAYAQLFVTQLERKKEANSVFSMILLWMSRGSCCTYFGLMLQAGKAIHDLLI